MEPPVEFWNIDTQFGRAGRYINHPANLPTIKLKTIYIIVNIHFTNHGLLQHHHFTHPHPRIHQNS